jgi:hypothetical protein
LELTGMQDKGNGGKRINSDNHSFPKRKPRLRNNKILHPLLRPSIQGSFHWQKLSKMGS